MKPPPFEYYDPRSVDEAVQLLSTLDDVKVLAGGQSLMPMLNMRFLAPDHIVDLNRLDDLRYIRRDGDAFVIGAMTTQRDLERSDELGTAVPLLREALFHVGHMQTRSRGTIGGSLCHLDPAAELPLVALAMDATITAQSVRGTREIEMGVFPQAYMMPALESDEIVTEIRINGCGAVEGYAFEEFSRRHGDFGVISVCVLLRGAGERIEKPAIAVGGATSVPVRAHTAEQRLAGKEPDLAALNEVSALAADMECVSDIHASAAYRKHLVEVLTRRALRRAVDRRGRRP